MQTVTRPILWPIKEAMQPSLLEETVKVLYVRPPWKRAFEPSQPLVHSSLVMKGKVVERPGQHGGS